MALRGDRYELLAPIASGGMATVHLARVLGAGGFERLVAIKVMHPHLAGESEFVAMFLDEARLAARIRHPNVVSTLDVHTDEQGVFLVMEYVEGPSLDKILRTMFNTKQRIPIEIILKICLDAFAGLDAAHELRDSSGSPLNLVHRDVSPQNILVGVDGIARLTDFGVARAEERLSQRTQTGQVKGKVAYMSPEQAINASIDRRTDIYAAGVVLWEALTNQRLIREANELLTMLKVREGNHKSPREFDALVPAAISDACMVALRKNPDERYPTAAAFAEALEKAAAEDGISIASSRAVGAFVTACQAHVPASSLPMTPAAAPVTPDPLRRAATPQSDPANQSAPAITPEPVVPAGSTPSAMPSSTVVLPVATDSGASASSTSAPAKRNGLVFAGVAAVVAMLFIVWGIVSTARNSNELPSASDARNSTATASVPTPPEVRVEAPMPIVPASSVVESPADATTAAASSQPVPTVKSSAKPAESRPSKVSPVYRPSDL